MDPTHAPNWSKTLELVIINPLTADIHAAREKHPFKHVPSAHYWALLLGRLNRNPSLPPAEDAEKIADWLRWLAVPLGCLPNDEVVELYADYYAKGGPDMNLPYWLPHRDAEEYIMMHFQ